MQSLNEIRTTFLDYFEKNGHAVVPSSSLVPKNDPTLMFTAAGMVQFKNLFTGLEHRDYTRAATSQKCVRAGGKHNDLDNVGYTARHLTFFEMLGNFSFGDYFKADAIPFAWELVTDGFGLPKDKLLITVYHDDDEAAGLWKKVTGFSDDRILRIPTDDNFWTMGPTGPCGPCSEIFIDQGEHIWGGPPGTPEEDGDRFLEIWNLVFMQFEQFEDAPRADLPKPSIDTGMGLERIGAVLQGKHDVYDTDLMRALIEASAHQTSVDPDGPGKTHHRVIADHLRSTAFLIADGVLPSNEGRGYVLRRIMRRAMRHAHLLGAQDPLMHRLVPELARQMGEHFPELVEHRALVADTLEREEIRFRRTLDRGLGLLEEEVGRLAEGEALPGAAAFKLYDTYGFPLDLTQDALRERGRTVDTDGFDAAMAEQKRQARAAWAGTGEAAEEGVFFAIREEAGPTEFLGYDGESAEGVIRAIAKGGNKVASASVGEEVAIVLNQTPFYAESGGQVGDEGLIDGVSGRARVTDVKKKAGDVFVHLATVENGTLSEGEPVRLSVDGARRAAIRANHSATHLMHEALRAALGDHVAQRGSLVAPDRLRFDFQHAEAMTADELSRVEAEVNDLVRQDSPVTTRLMTPDDAVAEGARALFGEKYGEEVRVVSMGLRDARHMGGESGPAGLTYSLELCGGTHVARTGEIGLFKIMSEGASSAGIRRVEALTGAAALAYIAEREVALDAVAAALKARPAEAADRVMALLAERRQMEQEIGALRKRVALGAGAGEAAGPRDVAGVRFLAQSLSGVNPRDLRGLIDEHKKRLGSGVVLLVAEAGGKASIAAGVTEDLTTRVSAIDIVKAAVGAVGGVGGGGRPDMAQGGGPDPEKADDAIRAAEAVISG
ncbi:MAG: alanine--tRNA ligase [Pseudomonadota bacterium]